MTGLSLSTSTLETRDLALDKARLEQRLEAFRNIEPSATTPLIIKPGDTPKYPAKPEVPEVSAEEFTAQVLREAIAAHGSLIVRGLFPAAQVSSMKSSIDRVLEAYETPHKVRLTTSNHYFNPPENLVSMMPEKAMGLEALRLFSAAGGSALCVESPSIAEMLLEFYEHHGLKDVVTQYMHEPPVLSVKKWVLRRSELPIPKAGWHQDGAFMGSDINTLNLWFPLTECGGASGAPGMDLIPARLSEIIKAEEGAIFDWSVSDDQAYAVSGAAGPISPVFNPGDAFFFDHFYLHRTQYRDDFIKQRYAIETWFFGSSSFPKDQVPIAW